MAFGFGFNKQKTLSAAEKFVQQGKLQNAIAEYDKILKHDAKDLTVINTIGDLYSRLGDAGKAIECFKTVGEAYAAQGFTVKGIAMYKKITKLQSSVEASLKLAELYTQQGLFNDARAQYLQVAEAFMKNGELDQAVRLFQKVLEMDPENVPMRVKLAEVYVKLGKTKEAWEIFSAAAEALRARGSTAAAEDVLKRMLVLEPSNSYVLLLRGRACLENDDPKGAIAYLEKAADIDSHPDGLRDLLKAYLHIGPLTKAVPVAEKLLTVHNDPEGLFLLGEGCGRLGQYRQALEVYSRHADRLLAGDSTKLLASLHSMITHVREDSEALETLLSLLSKAGESTHINEVSELLAHSSVKDGNLARARDLYRMLAKAEPQNRLHMQNYQQVVAQMDGVAPNAEFTSEVGTVIVEELEATAPVIDQSYPDDIAIALRSAITDADLFLSYNLPDKAIVPLLAVLPQAPHDVRVNQRLAALHTRFQHFAEAAVCCRTLESVFRTAGHPDEAQRYGELATRYEQHAEAMKAAASASAESSATAFAAAAADRESAASPAEFAVHELGVLPSDTPELAVVIPSDSDAASQWEESLSIDESAPAVEASDDSAAGLEISETVEEVRFYVEHFMLDQARDAFEKLETLTSDPGILDALRGAIESASEPPAELEPEITEINGDDPSELTMPVQVDEADEIAAAPGLMSGYGDSEHRGIHEPPPNLRPAPAPPEPPYMAPAPAASTHAEAGDLNSFVADLEASLGDSFEVPAAPAASAAPALTEPIIVPAPPIPAATRFAIPIANPFATPPATSTPPPAMAASSSNLGPGAGAATAPAPVAVSYSPSPVRPLGAGAQAMHPAGSVDLSEMFGELKQELEEDIVAGDDDPETHYNLGVAFREMGLLDEAIAELQKVCTAIDHGKPFAQPVQTYTWLAQCFLDKGVPEAAIRWYETALNLPGLDDEARLAINYELGAACEVASDKAAALRHFTAVYGSNIDYRDVAERIQALKS